ncbi:MAG: hypothetical protein E7053_08890 [Lentisphaerae bacterium]|nr:hypothetical protein [Lentisphaerota bacterium]
MRCIVAFPKIIFDSFPQWVELYEYSCQLALENIDSKEYRPGWLPQMTCMPGWGKIWQWDSCFMAFFAKYFNNMISPMNNLDNLYSLQRSDGYISMAYMIESGEPAFGERINPPLYAWCEWEYYRFSGDKKRVEKVLPILKKYYKWIENNRRRKNQLYFFEDSGSSGMDNAPRSAFPAANLAGSDVCWIDLACQQVLSARSLAKLSQVVNSDDDVEFFNFEAERISALINLHHYKSSTGFYYDLFDATFNALANKTVAGFWPMVSEVADLDKVHHLIKHLNDKNEFNTPHPVPVLSKDDPNYTPDGGYWLGSVWAPTNYMVVKGLQKYGYHALAREIAVRHVDMMSKVYHDPAYPSVWECYSPEYIKPATKDKNPAENGLLVRDRFVGWSALGPVAMFIENIIGLDFDAPARRILWRISERNHHGIENFNFAGENISLYCNGNKGFNHTEIKVVSTGNFTISVIPEGRSETETTDFSIVPGDNFFLV